ncbi:hypothetical protein [uncultured Desulfuromusa sp.]|nr:hypothetical protein [uncultured Desulfuromusa sp.]
MQITSQRKPDLISPPEYQSGIKSGAAKEKYQLIPAGYLLIKAR